MAKHAHMHVHQMRDLVMTFGLARAHGHRRLHSAGLQCLPGNMHSTALQGRSHCDRTGCVCICTCLAFGPLHVHGHGLLQSDVLDTPAGHTRLWSRRLPDDAMARMFMTALAGWNQHFFGCTACAASFQRLLDAPAAAAAQSARDVTLWLWRAHNEVGCLLIPPCCAVCSVLDAPAAAVRRTARGVAVWLWRTERGQLLGGGSSMLCCVLLALCVECTRVCANWRQRFVGGVHGTKATVHSQLPGASICLEDALPVAVQQPAVTPGACTCATDATVHT
jgi:hypothetical protein